MPLPARCCRLVQAGVKTVKTKGLSLRGRAAPSQSREGSYVFAGSTQLSGRVLRDSHVASLLGMTRQGGAAVHQCSYTAESLCTRRSLSAATDAIGAHHFIDTRYESQALRRERHAAPLHWPVRAANPVRQFFRLHFPDAPVMVVTASAERSDLHDLLHR